MFSSLNALMLNSHANAHNDKNTINLRNANSQQKEQTWAIVKFKEMKKWKAMKSLQKEVSIEVSTSRCYNVISKDDVHQCIANLKKDSKAQNRNWNCNDIHAQVC